MRAADPELARRLWAGEDVRRSPTGESPAEVAERMTEALTEIAEAAEDHSTVVVVTHGLSGRVGTMPVCGTAVRTLAPARRPVQLRLGEHRPAPLGGVLEDRGLQPDRQFRSRYRLTGTSSHAADRDRDGVDGMLVG